MKWRPVIIAGLAVATVAGLVIWLQHARLVGHWVQVHTGTVNEPGPYYGFWSGFGSDLEEFGILGAVGAGIYSLVRKYNCHEPGCWRVGNHPAAGGQFNLCYRHHPDFRGKKPTHELIERLHREHLERQAAIHSRLQGDPPGPGRHAGRRWRQGRPRHARSQWSGDRGTPERVERRPPPIAEGNIRRPAGALTAGRVPGALMSGRSDAAPKPGFRSSTRAWSCGSGL